MPRRVKRTSGFLDNLFLARFERLSKVEVDDHTDVFLGTRAGEKYIVVKSRYPGNTQYISWNEAEARNVASLMNELLDAKEGSSLTSDSAD